MKPRNAVVQTCALPIWRVHLEHLGLRAEPLPTLRAQAPPVTLELFPAACITPSPSTTRALTAVLRLMA